MDGHRMAIGSALDVVHLAFNAAVDVMEAGRASLLLLDITEPILRVSASVGVPPAIVPSIGVPIGHGIAGTVVDRGLPLFGVVDGQTFISTPVTTGHADLPTPQGSFSVMSKPTSFVMHSPWGPGSPYWYPDSFIRYGLYFLGGGYYIHDASWRDSYGPGTNVWHRDANGDWITGSHGCVNVPLQPMIWLYRSADAGTPVNII